MEQDIVIPDYYCSARKIVNCQASVSDISKSISDDKIVIEGMCHWKIIYLSEEDDALHHISCEKRFCEYFSSGADNSNGSIRYKIKVKNTFCKLLSPQKAECKSLLCIAIQLKANQTKNQRQGKHRKSLQKFISRAITAKPLRSPSKGKKEADPKANQSRQPNPRGGLGKIKCHTYGFVFLMAIDPNARVIAIKVNVFLQHCTSPLPRKRIFSSFVMAVL